MNRKNIYFSIVIPCFNAGDYVLDALNSVLGQFQQSYEIVIVDDGSTDHSKNNIIEWIKLNPKINCHLIAQANKGPGAARNAALAKVTGEHLIFLDADDILLPGYGKEIECTLSLGNFDIVEYGYVRFAGVAPVMHKNFQKLSQLKGLHSMKDVITSVIANTAWYCPMRVYKRSLWNNILFPENCFYEDLMTLYKVFAVADNIFYLDKPLYGYRANELSITGNHSVRNFQDLCAAYWKIPKAPDYYDLMRVRVARSVQFFHAKLKISDVEYSKVMSHFKAVRLSMRHMYLLSLPDVFFYLFNDIYGLIDRIRFNIKKSWINR